MLLSGIVQAEQLDLPADPCSPFILKGRGGFYVDGEKFQQTFVEMGSLSAADTATINQMYFEFMRPVKATQSPVILIHGAG